MKESKAKQVVYQALDDLNAEIEETNRILEAEIKRLAVERAMESARPNRIFDASALEDWAHDRYLDLWEEWEMEAAAYIEFWEFMEREYGEELGEFERWWREQRGGS